MSPKICRSGGQASAAPRPITLEDVLGLCRKNVLRDPIPTAEHLGDFVALLNTHHRANAAVAVALERKSTDPPLPLPGAAGKVIDALCTARITATKFSALGDGFWVGLGAPPGEMTTLLTALASPALEAFLQPRPKKKRGPKLKVWHKYAAVYAGAIAAALRAAGHQNPSIEQANGPVAKIGAGIIKLVLGLTVAPASFATAVRDERERTPRN